ncbi:SPL family radical SAM protein [Paenibacillus agricola]|uniref:Radical SAM protein n=1 Tax=Paenibacillus agricola TaxID=2716264 RepID=A0ABX0JC43_9BACL|nr:radical SAM protein [Paenibacillus agricola]NHN32323.1 radical SAM protein [Paenibacillus agricola]
MQPSIVYKIPSRLLNPASGYLTGYSHTLNPYAGCSFACSYCYVREMPIAKFRGDAWGTWVDVKQEAAEKLAAELVKAKRKGPVTIFMSSSTDPYQPIEYKERITRSLLEAMVHEQPEFLFLQTRSPLVTRDIDLLLQLRGHVRVSMTVETDLEPIRRAFTPAAPPIAARLLALHKLVQAGVDVQATIAPVLPCSGSFAARLRSIVDRVCIDDFFMGDGSLGKRTGRLGIQRIYKELQLGGWYSPDAYLQVLAQLREHFQKEQIYVSQAGFLP